MRIYPPAPDFPASFICNITFTAIRFPVLALSSYLKTRRRKRSRPIMRVPLSQVAGMATYIAKNKMRPRPEWQKNLAADGGCGESVQDRPRPDSGDRAAIASRIR